MTVIDFLGRRFFLRKSRGVPSGVKDILVLRMDHLGDVILAEPFLTEITQAKPELRITFLVRSQARDLAESFQGLHRIVTFDPDWFERKPLVWRSLRDWVALLKLLKSIRSDVILDLRGDFRHILAARCAHPNASLISFGTTGGGFLLDQELMYPKRVHEVQRNRMFLEPFGIPYSEDAPVLSRRISSKPLNDRARFLFPAKKSRYIRVITRRLGR